MIWRGTGSPPRAWGQRYPGAVSRSGQRFTPTGVGTTLSPLAPLIPNPVHPHGRGDNSSRPSRNSAYFGSPPRAWGQLHVPHTFLQFFRFTPTGVGTTSFGLVRHPLSPVHPHGRGDNYNQIKLEYLDRGSPPRAWGQRKSIQSWPPWRIRFTPTGVGTTTSSHIRSPSYFGSPPRA